MNSQHSDDVIELSDDMIEFGNNVKMLNLDPDMDAYKLFAGQIPCSWTEEDCKNLFEEFGPVHSVNVVRDRDTKVSKGCCFVMFFHRKDALKAENSLHNNRVLNGLQHAMQVKPADCESQKKLFVGMLSKSMNEDDVKALFKEFGQIEDCVILKDSSGKSRGCGFLTFISRNCAELAIRKMHQTLVLKDCSKPIVVKFADTPKDRERKNTSNSSHTAATTNSSLNQLLSQTNSAATIISQLIQGSQCATTNQQTSQNAVAQQLLTGLTVLLPLLNSVSVSGSPSISVSVPSYGNANTYQPQQQQSQNLMQSALMTQVNAFFKARDSGENVSNSSSHIPLAHTRSDISSVTNASSSSSTSLSQTPSSSATSGAGDLQALLSAYGEMERNASPSANSSSNAQLKGPDGCNLFVYHLPQSMVDYELNALFSMFGDVLSAKVFVDNKTGVSKCFGFVSFDNLVSAQKAILGMNGFQIGSKRLKVQMKREKEKPYQR